ncbi:MAG: 2OG-Fe(II) oxygenase [Bdellovibrionaceae bacterium]|nr:2OG-Fe(II) oxygenase [Pseudobdellovibrionaceae bacterium]
MSAQGNWPQFCQKLNEHQLLEMMEQIEETGFYIHKNLLDNDHVKGWQQHVNTLNSMDQFKSAKIGKKEFESTETQIRSDQIYWLHEFTGKTRVLGDWLQNLSDELKTHFRLPIDFIESHFSIYPEGARYQKHIDNASGQSHRLFTFIFYLNPDWQPGHGGELVLYSPENPERIICQIEPKGGTFVLFRSDLFYHEVLLTRVPRYTYTGWLRRNARV